MADFDEKDIIKSAGSDFDDADIISEDTIEKETPEISKLESFGKGVQQGPLLGHADEFQGAVEGTLDKTQQFLNMLGLADKSPTQVNADLASQGFKGDIGPQNTTDLYREARDESRGEFDAAFQANPWSSVAGGVAGGLVTAPLMPGAIAAPLGQAARGAGMASKAALAARNAIPISAIAAEGLSSGDVISNPGGVAADTVEGIPVGMATAAGVQGGLDTGKMLIKGAGKMVPNVLKTAFKRGKAGIDTTGDEFYTTTNKRVNEVVDEVSEPIIAKSQSQLKAHDEQIANLDKSLGKIKDETQKTVDLTLGRHNAQNAVEVDALNRETVESAKKLQKHFGTVKKALGKTYDQLDEAAEATGIAPENRDVIGNFEQELVIKSGLPEGEIGTIMKKMVPLLGKKDIESFRLLKGALNNYFEHANPVVRRTAKQAYGALKGNYAKELTENGYETLANQMANTNKRWSALAELEDNFISNLTPNRATGQVEASKDTIGAMGSFSRKDPKKMADADFLTNLLKQADPEGAPGLVDEMQGLAGKGKALEQKPVLPGADDLLAQDPEYARLQELLAQAKKVNPMKVEGVDLRPDPQAMKTELTNLLPKFGMKSGSDVAENKLAGVMDFLRKAKGDQYVDELQGRMSPLNEDVALRNSQSSTSDNTPLNMRDMINRSVGGTSKLVNATGRGVKFASDKIAKAKEVVSRDILSKGVKQISNYSPEEMQQLSQKFSEVGGAPGDEFSRVLQGAKDKNTVSKNAIIFGLMQKPEFREILNKIVDQDVTNEQ